MPEGHTIHRLARDLATDLKGHPVRTEWRQDRFADAARRLDGRSLGATSANGKHLFLHFVDGPATGPEVLHIHLGLFGKFRRRSLPVETTSDALRVRLIGPERAWDLTGAIICDLRGPDVLDEVAAKLGPDPLRRDADPGRFVAKVRRSKRAIGDLLLDQAVIAGIGNVYRAEILFLEGISPERPGVDVTDGEAMGIWNRTQDLLRDGVKRNRIVTVPADERPNGTVSRAGAVFAYKRDECKRCGDRILHDTIGGRNLYWCPTCQAA